MKYVVLKIDPKNCDHTVVGEVVAKNQKEAKQKAVEKYYSQLAPYFLIQTMSEKRFNTCKNLQLI